ncbi:MAG TPA: hypothetical protein VED41_08315, partial [Solirubrobacteraceae bacterium]|nr:hypothetical protein [Solirubrobacteraceae bacterium]
MLVRRHTLAVTALLMAVALAAALAWALADRGASHPLSAGRQARAIPGWRSGSLGRGTTHPSPAPAAPVTPAPRATPPPQGRPASVSVALVHPGPTVPSGFLGLSFENAALPRIATLAHTGALTQLLRSLGHGSLRFGGISADTGVAWSPDGSVPRWASVAISTRDLASVAALVRSIGWKILLTVNLGHYDPGEAAGEAAAAHALLGTDLAAIEIANEPDRFHAEGLRPASWNFPRYEEQFDAYRNAIAQAAPTVAFAAPDASSGMPVLPWVRQAAQLHPALLTDHYYPLTACDNTPTVGELLSGELRAGESSMLSSLRAIQGSSAIPLRLDETNDISCKGEPGVSNTFASALWAADYIPRAMATGIQGLDFHDLISLRGAYSPLVASATGLHANPEWYALLLAQRL